MKIEEMDRVYLKVRRIEGWLSPHACRLIAILDECQKRHGITGDLFEIGVWHGKSAIPLAFTLADEELLTVCDLFDDVPGGESIKLRRFKQNMMRFFGEADFLRVYAKSSREISSNDFPTRCRLIHVDGAHDSCNVYNDLVLAESCLHENGAIVMDDVYQPAWPGVTDGIYRYLHEHPGRLAPVASGFKKMVLVRPHAQQLFSEHLANSEPLLERFAGSGPHCYKVEKIMGAPVHFYYDRPAIQAAFCPGLADASFKRFPWLRNPVTRWLNRKLRGLRA